MRLSAMSIATLLCCFLVCVVVPSSAFVPAQGKLVFPPASLFATPQKKKKTPPAKKEVSLKELMQDMQKNPDRYIQNGVPNKKRARRTRRRVEAPQQQYVYAAQRNAVQQAAEGGGPAADAKALGLAAANQHGDAPVAAVEPEIVATLQLDDKQLPGSSFAYIIDKPAGWSILGGKKKQEAEKQEVINRDAEELEDVDEAALLAAMTREEIEEYRAQDAEDDFQDDGPNFFSMQVDGETLEWDEASMLAVMTPEEIAELQGDGMVLTGRRGKSRPSKLDKKTVQTKMASQKASFAPYSRPSVVSWLKELKSDEGTPIRGGKYWTAVAGATNVDDSGLVVICPKDRVNDVFIDVAKYVAVVGNGKYLAPASKDLETIPKESIQLEVIAKLKRGRADDVVITVGMDIVEQLSTCNQVLQFCQDQLKDGIRGDPVGNPFDRRAPRRLIHCDALAVSSLSFDEKVEAETEFLPDDIALLADRRNSHEFLEGSFLGRAELMENPFTTAFREINGAADGFQGWTVDRYDKWLLVQHDDQFPRGPLPSIHDGNTVGVYYLPADPNRSQMGSADIRPTLLEGQPCPESNIPVQENGVTYLVTLDRDLSTGIFLDQRLQRAWLMRNCNENTRVLNCFAHCGAFSIAAASAGASTVSLDLNKKFLDRIPPQLELNGIDINNHDMIYGDCFDWLTRLAKRGEQYDIIILDPPSTSIGIKKKRWSIKNDMAELVALAAPMVKRGGLLWTTTNSATMHPIKFAKMCQQGLQDAGLSGAKLERIVPMPVDFPSVGTQPVKNLVWRIP